MMPLDPSSLPFGFLIFLGAIVCFGLAPELAGFGFILLVTWGLASHPLVTIALVALYYARWLLWDALAAFAAGIGLRLSGVFGGAERAERARERYEDRRSGASRSRWRRNRLG
jgi:hypothetical protein